MSDQKTSLVKNQESKTNNKVLILEIVAYVGILAMIVLSRHFELF